MEEKKTVAGTCLITTVDEKRQEMLGKTGGNRVISARLYYPAIYAGEPGVTIRNAAGEMYQSPTIYKGKYPLIIYNHGYGSYMEANNKLCCVLAQNGYFVASVGHAYESDPFELEDGSVIELDQSIKKRQISPAVRGTIAALRMKKVKGTPKEMYESFYAFQKRYCLFLNERLKEWADDIRCVESILRRDYASAIDFTRGIGITGHSFGGNLAYYMCMNYPEYVCGVNIDGAIFGEYSGQRMQRAFLQICNRGNVSVVSKALLDTDAPVEYEVFDGTTHMGFTDLAFFCKSGWMMGKTDAEIMSHKLLDLHLGFFEKYMQGNV